MDESAPVFFISDVDADLFMYADRAVPAEEVEAWRVTLVRPDGSRELVEPDELFITAHPIDFDSSAPHWWADHPTGSWFDVERPGGARFQVWASRFNKGSPPGAAR
jgi:hypothetical protein